MKKKDAMLEAWSANGKYASDSKTKLLETLSCGVTRAPIQVTIVLSSRTADRSGWACRWANRRGQMPWLHPAA